MVSACVSASRVVRVSPSAVSSRLLSRACLLLAWQPSFSASRRARASCFAHVLTHTHPSSLPLLLLFLLLACRYTIYKDHVALEDYEIHDGMGLELYYM